MRTPFQRLAAWPRRLHHQLMLTVSLLLLLALAVLGGHTAHEQLQTARTALDAQAASLARSVAVASADLILTDSLDGLEDLARRSAGVGQVRGLRIHAPDGATLTHIERDAPGALRAVYAPPSLRTELPASMPPRPELRHADGLVVAWHPVWADRLIGWVRVDYHLGELRDAQAHIWRDTGVVAAVSVALCALLLWAYLRRPMQALTRARHFAHNLSQAAGQQMPVPSGPVEVAELTAALNDTSTLLSQQMLMIEETVRRVRAHEAQLAAQNDQLAAIFALSPDGLVTFDREGCVCFVNEAFLAMTGLSQSELTGRRTDWLDAALRRLSVPTRPFPGLEACFAPGLLAPGVLLDRSGPRRQVLALMGLSSGQAGTVRRLLYACDVTRPHTLDERKSAFLAQAAEALHPPVLAVLEASRQLGAGEAQSGAGAVLARLQRDSLASVNLLTQLRELARIEAQGAAGLVFEQLELGEVVCEALAGHRPPEGRDPPRWVSASLPMPVRADRLRLQQAIGQVLSNAHAYSPEGGEVVVRLVQAGLNDPAQRFGVAIEDHGIGLSEASLARVGERFFRVDPSGPVAGAGLGLSIAGELMDLMGGRIQVVSTWGEGTTVTLWL
ncbi:MAG: PAS domain S-box protein [Burkholderiales bacterium]|nr:PAS domain S-box protein [Burkholderiales bacterium]